MGANVFNYFGGNVLLNILIDILKIAFLLGFIILIHECGHFFMARWCKVKVKEFAIGFGPTIWRKQGDYTKYAVRLIPLGGFVNMLGEEERSEEEGSFNKANIIKRILIILAGGIVNILFGLVVYFILVSASGNYISTTIDQVTAGDGAQIAGIQSGDEIVKIEGKKIRLKSDLDTIVSGSNGNTLDITIKRGDETKDISVTPTKKDDDKYYLGVMLKPAENTFTNNIYYGFWDTMNFSTSIIDNLRQLFAGAVSTDDLMGPVGVSEVVTKTHGFYEFIYMVGFISLSLGVTNLLPFPPLDGGKVVLLIIEGIRRKPLKEKVEIGIQMVGFVLLIGLSIYVTYNDILRIF